MDRADFEFSEKQLDDLERALRELPWAVKLHVMGAGCAAAARVVAARAKTLFPVDTGELSRSIRVRRTSEKIRGRKVSGTAAQVIAGAKRDLDLKAHHAMLVELGTVRTAAQPYLAPAVRESRSPQFRAFAKTAERVFMKVARDAAAGRSSAAVKLAARDSLFAEPQAIGGRFLRRGT